MTSVSEPLNSLRDGRWFKLICGASYHHLPSIHILAAAYTLAGANCIDTAAEPAIVTAAIQGIDYALNQSAHWREPVHRPWLMISINDGEDPHFRKAAFDAAACPPLCRQPCVDVCPADAIAFSAPLPELNGVLDSRCYGCGRCLPVCPVEHIQTRSHIVKADAIAAQLFPQVDAVEIHTQIGRLEPFIHLWTSIQPWLSLLRAISISCPSGTGDIEYLWQLYRVVQTAQIPIIWQVDGRPMSGDIGAGTTQATIRYAQKIISAGPPGFIQLAGGTNEDTVPRLRRLGLLKQSTSSTLARSVAGVAYGSYARKLLMPLIEGNATMSGDSGAAQFDKSVQFPSCSSLGDRPETGSLRLQEAAKWASQLVRQLKPNPNFSEASMVRSV